MLLKPLNRLINANLNLGELKELLTNAQMYIRKKIYALYISFRSRKYIFFIFDKNYYPTPQTMKIWAKIWIWYFMNINIEILI